MNILLILDAVEYPLAPNPQLALRTAAALVSSGNAVSVLYLCGSFSALPRLPDEVKLFPLYFPGEAAMEDILEHGSKGGTPLPVRFGKLLCSPSAFSAAFEKILLHRVRRQDACRKETERLCGEHSFDAVITVNAPYYTAYALSEAKLTSRKIIWEMDPLTITGLSKAEALSRQSGLTAHADHVLITEYMAEHCDQFGFTPEDMQGKVSALPFPCYLPQNQVPDEDGSRRHEFTEVVFTGTLYPEIRTPHYALGVFCRLNDPRTRITFVGGGWEHYPDSVISEAKHILGDRLRITGPVSPSKAGEYRRNADILLNLGNSNDEQLPSKIFDYFGTGKPVIHIAKSPTDPSIPYFGKYPYSFICHESEAPETVSVAMGDFIRSHAGKLCDMQLVNRLFASNTPASVAENILKIL